MSDPLEARLREELAPELEVLRTIGRGSVATVVLAREPALKRLVAVKVLRPDVATDETTRRRFEREAQAAARLNHPNVTDIYRVGRLRLGVPFIVMEYIDGRNLADALTARGRLTVEEVRQVIAGVADALDAAHANGIIHRDIRPANVIREEQTGRIVLTDFGIAALLESGGEATTQLTTMGHRIGDPRYMSPEQLSGEPLTVQADVYSLGVLGFELLTGEGPFGGRGKAAEVMSQLRGEPRRISELRPDADPRLAALIERCLARRPEHRPRARDVLLALAGLPARDLRTSAPQRVEADGGVLEAFFEEVKRRRVWRVGVAYAMGGALVIEFGGNTLKEFRVTEALYAPFVVTVLAGFPVSLLLAWVFDIREGRVSRAPTSAEFDEAAASPGVRRLLPALGLGLSALLALVLGWWLLFVRQ